MENDFVEIEEHFKDGIIIKRLINGVEQPVGEGFPEHLAIQNFKGIQLKQVMTQKDAIKLYGYSVGTKTEYNNLPKQTRLITQTIMLYTEVNNLAFLKEILK